MSEIQVFADRLREERKRLGITQADAALLGGVTREAWNRYEKGSMPNAEVLVSLMGHGFDINFILGGTRLIDAEAQMPEPERILLERYRSTDDEGRAAIDRAALLEAIRVLHAADTAQVYEIGRRTPRHAAHEPPPRRTRK